MDRTAQGRSRYGQKGTRTGMNRKAEARTGTHGQGRVYGQESTGNDGYGQGRTGMGRKAHRRTEKDRKAWTASQGRTGKDISTGKDGYQLGYG